MDPAKVAMLQLALGLRELPGDLEPLVSSMEFWEELEATDEADLTNEQRRVVGVLAPNLLEER